DLTGQPDELVGGLAHRRDGHHDVVAAGGGGGDALGRAGYALGAPDGRAAVLLDDQPPGPLGRHDSSCERPPPPAPPPCTRAGGGYRGRCTMSPWCLLRRNRLAHGRWQRRAP